MKLLIVEDELNAANKLISILQHLKPKAEILPVCHAVSSAIHWINNHPSPDLIFMDIQLSDGLSFEIFKQVEINCPIIFITAFNNFAIQAFKVNSVDYILKPYAPNEVAIALTKYENYHLNVGTKYNEQLYNDLTFALTPNFKSRFYAKLNNKLYSIETQNVHFIKYEDQTTILFDKTNRKFVIDYSLDALMELLDPSKFFRINRQCILSFQSIAKMDISAKNRVDVTLKGLKNKEQVSRAKTSEFKSWLDQ